MPFVADDRGAGRVQPRLALEPRGDLLIASLAACLDGHDLGLFLLDHGVEGVDHLLRIEQRIEPVVGAQLEQLVELALRLLALAGEEVETPSIRWACTTSPSLSSSTSG